MKINHLPAFDINQYVINDYTIQLIEHRMLCEILWIDAYQGNNSNKEKSLQEIHETVHSIELELTAITTLLLLDS
jgi:hypothetical protein